MADAASPHAMVARARRGDGPTLGAVAIARNEIGDIRGFVEHLRGWIDEIVVVDDGSTDGTLEYLAECGPLVTVLQRRLEPEGGFAAQRNTGMGQAKSDWLVHMDIDERITPELALEIRAAIRSTDKNAFRYRRLNYFLHRPFAAGGWQNWNEPQLGRRGAHRFVRPIHERVEVDGGEAATGQLTSMMLHFNDESFKERVLKNAGYLEKTANEIVASGRSLNCITLLLEPLRMALIAYFWNGAYRKGTLGLIFALTVFTGRFNQMACAWSMVNRTGREQLEAALRDSWGCEREGP